MFPVLLQRLTHNKPSVNFPNVVMAPSIGTIIFATETQR